MFSQKAQAKDRAMNEAMSEGAQVVLRGHMIQTEVHLTPRDRSPLQPSQPCFSHWPGWWAAVDIRGSPMSGYQEAEEKL